MLEIKGRETLLILTVTACVLFIFTFGLYSPAVNDAHAQDMFIYPEKGQSQEQQEKDKYQCYTWAKKETGFDPMETPKASRPPPEKEEKKGGVAKGAVIGGVGGAAVGGIAGGGKGAGIGAAVGAGGGAAIGGMRMHSVIKHG